MARISRTIESDLAEIERRAASDLSFFDGKRVLVTGGAGFLLSYFVELLSRRDATVVVADTFVTGHPTRLAHLGGASNVSIQAVDVSTERAWGELGGPFDVVVHGASIASPIAYRARPIETIEANVLGTLQLLRATTIAPCERFVLMSTSEVYGDPDPRSVPTPESYEGRVSFTGPRACYDESKRLAETLATTYARVHHAPIRIVRPFNVYGPGMSLDDGRVVPSLVRDALRGVDLVLHSDGTPRRSFCYIADFMVSFVRVIVGGQDGEPYNVGDDRAEISMSELARAVVEATATRADVIVRASDEAAYLVDNPQRRRPELTKLRSLGGADAQIGLAEGLRRYVAWAREGLEA